MRAWIEVTAKLELSYLWIDVLCIVQDDEKTKFGAMENMASIYINAFVTLVAAGGDTNASIPGIHGLSESRSTFPTPHSLVWASFQIVHQGLDLPRTHSFESWHILWGDRLQLELSIYSLA
jgi:hypothetical protein